MRCEIVTIISTNYGNRLQNYATQELLTQMGFKVTTRIVRRHPILTKMKWLYQSFRLKTMSDYFAKFNIKIDWKYVKKYSPIEDFNVDFFVAGSDQVWNPAFSNTMDQWKYYLLDFVHDGKRISYAASIGVDRLDKTYQTDFKAALLKYSAVSMREESGRRIVKELTGRDAEVLIDPTMMLDKSDWLKIAHKPKKIDTDRPYILTYFLGGRSERVNRTLNQFAQEYKCQVYNLMDLSQPEVYVSGPSEFIYLFSRAKLILTDSFHACVFSFLFEKPFLVYAREGEYNNMMSRLDTFLKKFHLERKYVDSGLPNDILESDYQKGYEVLSKERQKTMEYLKSAMNIQQQKE